MATMLPETHSLDDLEKKAESISDSESRPHTRPDTEHSQSPVIRPPLERVVSLSPDGGLIAWLQVAGAWSLMFNTFGLINTFGVYQTYYESGELFQSTSSNIAWIGSIQAYCIMLIGFLSGPIFDAGHLRVLLLTGSFLVVFGHMMLSFSHTYWQVLLAQGFAVGLGSGLLFVPSVAIMPQYFTKRLGLAIGLAASGSSLGGIIYPIVFYKLIGQLGFAWSVRVLGFIALALLMIPVFCMRIKTRPTVRRALLDLSAFTDPNWIFFVTVGTLGFAAVYTVIIYISFYAQAAGITSTEMAFYLVPILNVGSIIGRTVPNYLSDKYGTLNIMAPSTVVVGILTFCLIAATSQGAIITIALLYGIFSGVFFSMPPVIFVRITKDKSRIGTRIGMGFTLLGLGALAGGPGGGGVLGTASADADLHWTSLFTYGGVCAIASGVGLMALRFYITGLKIKAKA